MFLATTVGANPGIPQAVCGEPEGRSRPGPRGFRVSRRLRAGRPAADDRAPSRSSPAGPDQWIAVGRHAGRWTCDKCTCTGPGPCSPAAAEAGRMQRGSSPTWASVPRRRPPGPGSLTRSGSGVSDHGRPWRPPLRVLRPLAV